MRDEPDDKNASNRSTDPAPSRCPETNREWDIQYEDLSEIETGDVIAVRASADSCDSIVAGPVSWRTVDHPHEQAQNSLEEAQELGGSPNHWRVAVLNIDANIWWVIVDGDVSDRSEELQDRPQMQPHLGEPPQDPPDCAISYRNDGRLDLTIPGPISNGHRVKYYSPDPFGTIVEIEYGGIVNPERLLPDDIESIE